jgi:DNA polymerase
VFGEGPADARVLVLGEQPGNQEDIEGHPFVGPSGRMFDKALAELGIDRSRLYVTNTVKHFKFEQRGKVRLHKRANAAERAACRLWLRGELQLLAPEVVVCLGAMASAALFGNEFRLTQERGQWRDVRPGMRAFATAHPSSLLRAPDRAGRERAWKDFLRDLSLLKKVDL